MKTKTLVDAVPALRKLSAQDMALSTLHRLHILIGKATPHLQFYDEKRNAILKKYCVEDGGRLVPLPDKKSALERDIGALLDVDIDDIEPITVSGEDVKLSYADYVALGGIIDFEKEDNA